MSSSNEEYIEAINGLEEFGHMLCGLIEGLLKNKGIKTHSIAYRVKNAESTLRKMGSEKYTNIGDIADLLGVRIITYFPDDVDEVASIITKEFSIDNKNSEDKRKLLDPDKFGYLSLHFLASLSATRKKLGEYKHFSEMRFELQIRSILQHAWAEIEHDIGYKAETSAPKKTQRRFSRLAGMLELADEEFERLRDDLSEYEKQVNETIKSAPQTLKIDQSTLSAAFETEKILNDLDKIIASYAERPLAEKIDSLHIGGYVNELNSLGVNNIKFLVEIANTYKKYISTFAKYWLKRRPNQYKGEPMRRGIGLFYLNYILAAQLTDKEVGGWGKNIQGRDKGLLDEVRLYWKKVVSELGKPSKYEKRS